MTKRNDLLSTAEAAAYVDLSPRTLERYQVTEPQRRAMHAFVVIHLEGSAARPWCLPDRACAFGARSRSPAIDRVYVALHDTSGDAHPDTARTLVRLTLGSGTDD